MFALQEIHKKKYYLKIQITMKPKTREIEIKQKHKLSGDLCIVRSCIASN